MKRLLFPALLAMNFIIVNAQSNEADSLLQLIKTTQKDTSKCLLLVKLSGNYIFNDPDSAMQLVQQALVLAEKEKFERGKAICLNSKGSILDFAGNYPEALQCGLKALQINEGLHDENGIAASYGVVANVYCDEGENKKAIGYLLQSKAIYEKRADNPGIASALISLGDNYEHANILDSARLYNEQGYELALKLNEIDAAGMSLENLGNVYSKMHEIPLALDYYRMAVNNYRREDDEEGISQTTVAMAKLFTTSNQNDSAFYYAKQSLGFGMKGRYFPDILEASTFLTVYFKSTHQYDSAFVYQDMVLAAKDSLFSEEKVKELQKLSYNEQQRQQEIAEQKLKDEETNKRNLQLAGIAVFIPTFCLFVLFLGRRKVKSRTVEFFGIVALLMVFEFITLLIHPFVQGWTNDAPVLMLVIMVLIAAVLVPMHHKMEEWIKEKLAHKTFTIKTKTNVSEQKDTKITGQDIN